MALAIQPLDERWACWGAICYMRRAVAVYDTVIGAPSRHAQVLWLPFPSEAMEANSETPPPDARTEEKRQNDAVKTMPCMPEMIGRAGPEAAAEVTRLVLDDQRPRDVAAMLAALRQISCGIDRNALTSDWQNWDRAMGSHGSRSLLWTLGKTNSILP